MIHKQKRKSPEVSSGLFHVWYKIEYLRSQQKNPTMNDNMINNGCGAVEEVAADGVVETSEERYLKAYAESYASGVEEGAMRHFWIQHTKLVLLDGEWEFVTTIDHGSKDELGQTDEQFIMTSNSCVRFSDRFSVTVEQHKGNFDTFEFRGTRRAPDTRGREYFVYNMFPGFEFRNFKNGTEPDGTEGRVYLRGAPEYY